MRSWLECLFSCSCITHLGSITDLRRVEVKCSSFAICDLPMFLACIPYVKMSLIDAPHIRILTLVVLFVVAERFFFSPPRTCSACRILCVIEGPFLFCMFIRLPSIVAVIVVFTSL